MSEDLGVLEGRHRQVSLRYHARARHGYFGSRIWSTLSPEWDEADATPFLTQIRKCGYLEAVDAVLPHSEDSWEHFVRDHGDGIFNPDIENYGASGGRLGLAAPARLQQAWEDEESCRREALRAESDRQWLAEEERRRRVEEDRARRFAEAEAREAAAFRATAERAWAAEPAQSLLVAAGKLERTAAGDLTPVVWQTDGLYRVEGARRVLRNSNRVE